MYGINLNFIKMNSRKTNLPFLVISFSPFFSNLRKYFYYPFDVCHFSFQFKVCEIARIFIMEFMHKSTRGISKQLLSSYIKPKILKNYLLQIKNGFRRIEPLGLKGDNHLSDLTDCHIRITKKKSCQL